MEGESHFHPCPSCQSAVECLLVIGDSDCGKAKCASCSQPPVDLSKFWINTTNADWIHYGCPVNGAARVMYSSACKGAGTNWTTCDKCHIELPVEIRQQNPNALWYVRDKDDPVEEEEEAESCDNCGEGITSENPAMEWDGEDRCKDCYPHCFKCDSELEDGGDHGTCENCAEVFCSKHIFYCSCCEVYVCENHRSDHGT